jgi:hypothetical protein
MGEVAPCPKCGKGDCERRVTIPAAGHKEGGSGTSNSGTTPNCGFS